VAVAVWFDGGSEILAVSDYGNCQIRKILSTYMLLIVANIVLKGLIFACSVGASTTTTTLAGNYQVCGYAEGIGVTARLTSPNGLEYDSSGSLYFCDVNVHVLRKVETSFGAVTTVAGSNSAGYIDGAATAALFTTPVGVAISSSGIVYITDACTVRAYDPEEGVDILRQLCTAVMTCLCWIVHRMGVKNCRNLQLRIYHNKPLAVIYSCRYYDHTARIRVNCGRLRQPCVASGIITGCSYGGPNDSPH
jgi:sugar lactone lactonase YvrE